MSDRTTYTDDMLRRELQDLVRAAWLSQAALDRFDQLTSIAAAAEAWLAEYDNGGLRSRHDGRLIAGAEMTRRALRGEEEKAS